LTRTGTRLLPSGRGLIRLLRRNLVLVTCGCLRLLIHLAGGLVLNLSLRSLVRRLPLSGIIF